MCFENGSCWIEESWSNYRLFKNPKTFRSKDRADENVVNLQNKNHFIEEYNLPKHKRGIINLNSFAFPESQLIH